MLGSITSSVFVPTGNLRQDMGLNQPVLEEKATAFGQVTQKVGSFVRENPATTVGAASAVTLLAGGVKFSGLSQNRMNVAQEYPSQAGVHMPYAHNYRKDANAFFAGAALS